MMSFHMSPRLPKQTVSCFRHHHPPCYLSSPVSHNLNWEHLKNVHLADSILAHLDQLTFTLVWMSSLSPCWMASGMDCLACPPLQRPNLVRYWLGMLILFLLLILFLIMWLSYLVTTFFISFGKWRNHPLRPCFLRWRASRSDPLWSQPLLITWREFHWPLAKCSNVPQLGELWLQAVRRFLNLERSLHSKSTFESFA